MASWAELPYPVLKRIFVFLPIYDIVNATKAVSTWKPIAVKSLVKIKIDDSTAYNGSFYEHNCARITGRRTPGSDLKLFDFINDLTECTDGIQYIDINVFCISSRCVEKLLMSQKAIKCLVLREREDDKYDYNFKSLEKTCIREIVNGILKHESTLEKINIGIQELFIRFEDLAKGLKEKESCFHNLKSVEFLSTIAGHFGMDPCTAEHLSEILMGTEEEKNAAEVFDKMFSNSKIEELNFRPKLPIDSFYAPTVYWHPVYMRMIRKHFPSGAFSNLRRINVDSLNPEGMLWEIQDADAEMLIRYCPMITHIDSDTDNQETNGCFSPVYNDSPWIRLVENYGHQLVYFKPLFMSTNIAKSVYKNCPNMKTIRIYRPKTVDLTDDALLSLTELKDLRRVDFNLEVAELEETILKFLNKVCGQLTRLIVKFQYGTLNDPNILHIISQNGANLKKLQLEFGYAFSDCEFKVLMDGFLAILQRCQNLRILAFGSCSEGSSFSKETHVMYIEAILDILINRCKKLEWLRTDFGLESKECYRKKLIEGMPQCRLELYDLECEYLF